MCLSTADCICISGFWGLCPQTPTGALPLDPAGGLPSPDPLCPPYLQTLAMSLVDITLKFGEIFRIKACFSHFASDLSSEALCLGFGCGEHCIQLLRAFCRFLVLQTVSWRGQLSGARSPRKHICNLICMLNSTAKRVKGQHPIPACTCSIEQIVTYRQQLRQDASKHRKVYARSESNK